MLLFHQGWLGQHHGELAKGHPCRAPACSPGELPAAAAWQRPPQARGLNQRPLQLPPQLPAAASRTSPALLHLAVAAAAGFVVVAAAAARRAVVLAAAAALAPAQQTVCLLPPAMLLQVCHPG